MQFTLKRFIGPLVGAALALTTALAIASGGGDDHGKDRGGKQAASGEHGHAGGHDPHHDWNLWYGWIGESEELDHPTIFFRPKGWQPPFAATLLNTALLFFLIYRFGKQPIANALKKRRDDLMSGMDEAARMRGEASDRLEDYEEKLRNIEDEIQRLRRDMKKAAEAERERVLADARARKERMERDARQLVDAELKALRQQLTQETVRSAVGSARAQLEKNINPGDQARLAEEYLSTLEGAFQSRIAGGNP